MSVMAIDPGNALSFSSFGAAADTFGTGFRSRTILFGDRYMELNRRQSYYDCTQHDSKVFDFDGRFYNPRSTQPLMSSEQFKAYVPLKARRPSTPYRLGKVIVDSFTNLVFGEGRFPDIRLEGDPVSEDFIQCVGKVGKLPLKCIQARNIGGSTGSVGMSWCFYNGKPRYEVHNPKAIFIHSWEDRVNLVVRHATECYLFYKVQWDGKGFNKQWYWFRRDWTKDWDIIFEDVPYNPQADPVWVPDEERSVNHADGNCHFHWIQNLPTDEIDGSSDYEGLFDQFDQLDILYSVVSRGAILNLDPTLKLKMDPDLVNRMGVKKGSDNSLVVGLGGDADYMELSGTSIEAGIKLVDALRKAVLETAQCVVANPDEVVAQGTSSVAQKMMFAPMTSKGEIIREQYGTAIERLLDAPLTIAIAKWKSSVFINDPATGAPEVDPTTGQPVEGQLTLDLPPKYENVPPLDPATGMAMVDPTTGVEMPAVPTPITREPGTGGVVNLRWPQWFSPTPDDQNKIVTTLSLATGGQAFLSAKTACELASSAFDVDPAEEQRRLEDQASTHADATAAMFPPGAAGEVQNQNELPPGAVPSPQGLISQEINPGVPEIPPDEGLNPPGM